jgi:hypothetical protein
MGKYQHYQSRTQVWKSKNATWKHDNESSSDE